MGSQEMLSSVFHFPAGITIDSIDPGANELVIGLACDTPSMPCPECHQLSARIHGHYQRTVADLPCAGRTVILALTVRKFVCSTPGAGAVLCADDNPADRACASSRIGGRWAIGHAASRPIRYRHHPVHPVTTSDDVACSKGTSGSGPWG